ncbi:MAG: hypothetical protein ACRDY7_08170 [Acidimicrobiia bacterium]
MSDPASTAAPGHGFWLALPPGWVSLDVDPSTSTSTIRRMVAAAAEADETVAANREELEGMLIDAARDCATSGVLYCAAYFEPFEDMAVQASLAVAVHAAVEGTDFGRMATELADGEGGRTIEVVDLDAGGAVKRSGRRRTRFPGTEEPLELLTHQFFIPVPGTTDLLAVVAFASPTLGLEADLVALFDAIADSFAFT